MIYSLHLLKKVIRQLLAQFINVLGLITW